MLAQVFDANPLVGHGSCYRCGTIVEPSSALLPYSLHTLDQNRSEIPHCCSDQFRCRSKIVVLSIMTDLTLLRSLFMLASYLDTKRLQSSWDLKTFCPVPVMIRSSIVSEQALGLSSR